MSACAGPLIQADSPEPVSPNALYTPVAEWIHFALFGIILQTIKLKVYTFGAYDQQLRHAKPIRLLFQRSLSVAAAKRRRGPDPQGPSTSIAGIWTPKVYTLIGCKLNFSIFGVLIR